jgi:hypothetical protein
MWWIKLLIDAVIAVTLIAVILNWETITNWFAQNKDVNSKYGTLIKKNLASGNYAIVANVFNAKGKVTASNTWNEVTLDQDTLRRFGRSNKLRYELTN